MHSVINTVINKVVQFYIPDMILRAAFRDVISYITLEAAIRDVIIDKIVLRDCNLYAGKLKRIILLQEYVKPIAHESTMFPIDCSFSIYEIPPDARENKDITVAIDLAYPAIGVAPYPDMNLSGNSLGTVASQALESVAMSNSYITPVPILIANNTIRMEPSLAMHVDWVFSCTLAYDINFTGITPSMVTQLTNLVALATKAYIYNKLTNDNQLARIVGGAEFSSFTDTVEGYSDAIEQYDEALIEFRGGAFFDKDSLISTISMMV